MTTEVPSSWVSPARATSSWPGRSVASAVALGMDRLDAIRVATAISEVGRDVVATGGGRALPRRIGQRAS